MARGLFAVLEDEMTEALPVEENTEQQEQIQELEAQVGEAEVVEEQTGVDEMQDTVEETVEALEELAEITDVVEDSVESGEGLSEDAAEIAEVAVEAICARLGYKPAKKPMPSMESFGNTSSRLDATKFALEGFKETAKKIWEGIKAFFSKIWEKISALWNAILKNANGVKARAESLNQKLDKAAADNLVADSEKKNDVKAYCVLFNAEDASKLQAGIKSTLGAHTAAAKATAAYNGQLAGLLDEVTKTDKPEEALAKIEGALELKLDIKSPFANGNTISVGQNGMTLEAKAVKVDAAEEGVVGIAELKTVVGHVNALNNVMMEGKASFGKAQDVVKKGISLADKLAKGEGEGAKEKAKAFRATQGALVLVNTKIPTLGLKACNAGLNYVAMNLKGYKKAEEKKAA